MLTVPSLLRFCVRSLERSSEQRSADVSVLSDNLNLLPEIVVTMSKTLGQLRNLALVFIAYKLMIIAAVLSSLMPLWLTMLSELIFVYLMWLAATREQLLQWTNPATQPKSIMQLPPPRKQRIFAPGLIR